MCIFCAAIPVTIALGASAQSKQNKKAILNPAKLSHFPVKAATALVITGLLAGSVATHGRLLPGL
jgi:hypothetical protein